MPGRQVHMVTRGGLTRSQAAALERALAEQDAYLAARMTSAPHEDALALAREDASRRYELHRAKYVDGVRGTR